MFYGRLVSKDETMTIIIASMEKLSGMKKDKLVESFMPL